MWAGQVCSAESKAESWQVVVGKLLLWELSVFLRTGQGSERASTCSCNTSQLVGKLLRGCRHGISYEGKLPGRPPVSQSHYCSTFCSQEQLTGAGTGALPKFLRCLYVPLTTTSKRKAASAPHQQGVVVVVVCQPE
ncbi:uncharacterized protein LAJ45_09010 [Morchella importuna]|uniref:uncharacterized protein n=1 Tax=Morchella importuna TaxID=1174673 RepID=UPI001E8D2546|nr:uncharacterized protein LAJ45_09010 [Morchella importuna]KAH8146930.1 hypothetical protein LAJ45_09010 [Morchella importuna]